MPEEIIQEPSEPEEESSEPGFLTPAAKERLVKNIDKLVLALIEARKQRPNEQFYSVSFLKKFQPLEPKVVKRIAKEHAFPLWRALNEYCKISNLPRWRRVLYYESSAIWP